MYLGSSTPGDFSSNEFKQHCQELWRDIAARHPDRQIDAQLWQDNLDKLVNVHQGLLQSKHGDKLALVQLANDTAQCVARLVRRKLHVGLPAGLDWPLGLEGMAREVKGLVHANRAGGGCWVR